MPRVPTATGPVAAAIVLVNSVASADRFIYAIRVRRRMLANEESDGRPMNFFVVGGKIAFGLWMSSSLVIITKSFAGCSFLRVHGRGGFS